MIYIGDIFVLHAWQPEHRLDPVKLRVQNSVFARSKLKMTLGRGSRPNPFSPLAPAAVLCAAPLCAHPEINSSSTMCWLSGHQTAARVTASSLQSKCPQNREGLQSLAVPAKDREDGCPTCKAGRVL